MTDAPRKRGGFAAKSLASIVIKIGAAGLSFVMFVALARAMTQEGFGQFGFAFSLATILGVTGALGQRNLVLRFAAIYLQEDDRPRVFGVIHHSYKLVLLGTGALALGLIGASFLPMFEAQSAVLAASAALTITLGLAEFQPHPQRAAGKVWLALLPRDILLRLAMIGLAGLVLLNVLPTLSAVQVILMMSLFLLLLVIVQAVMLPYTHPLRLLREDKDTSERPKWRQTMWGMWGNSVLNSSGRNVAMVMLGALLPAAAIGAVFAALRTSMVLELFLVAINIVAAPMLAGRLHQNKLGEAQSICRKISIMLGIPTLIAFLVFVFFGDLVLELFGDGYASAHTELIILSTGYLVSAFAGPTAQLMEMGGHERAYFRMLAITTGLSLVSLPFVTAAFGSIGAAICIAGNLIALNLWAYLFIYRTTGISAGVIPLGPRPTD